MVARDSVASHVLRLRGLVLRYGKALLALLTTALAVYAGDAIVAGLGPGEGMTVPGSVALAAVVLDSATDSEAGALGFAVLAVLAGSSVAVIIAAFSGRFRSLTRIP